MQVDVRAQLRAERAGVIADPRRPGQSDRVDLVSDLLGQPEPQVHPAAARVVARFQSAQQQTRDRGRGRHPAERRDEEDETEQDQPQRSLGQEVEAREQAEDPARSEQPGRPPQPREDEQRHPGQRLHPLHDPRRRTRDAERVRQVVELGRLRLDGIGHLPQPGKVVDVGHRELGSACADARDELGCGERAAAELEEVGILVIGPDAEHRDPLLGEPRRRPRQRRVRGIRIGQRPRQRRLVDLSRRANREVVDHREQRDERRRQRVREFGARGLPVEAFGRHDVADQERNSAFGALDDHGRGGHRGEGLQGGLDFAEFDPSTADLDLIVGAALEEQARRIEPDQVAGAIRAVPPEGRHRSVLLGILQRIEVARETDAADDELADLRRPRPGFRWHRRPRGTSPPAGGRSEPDPPRRAARRRRPPSPRWGRRCSTPRDPRRRVG